MGLVEEILGAMPSQPLVGLEAADRRWRDWRDGNISVAPMVATGSDRCLDHDCDVLVCGSTLGLLMATVLQRRGWQVIILERGILQGREQEWNISRNELAVLLELELLSKAELSAAIASEFNPLRIQFHGGEPLWIENILNIGVSPRRLLALLKEKFLTWGGKIFENSPCSKVVVTETGAIAHSKNLTFRTRLLLDGMGHFSPIAQQARGGQKPDGVCLVVGGCAQGFDANHTGDLIYSFTPIRHQCQYFWEAFPAEVGRTTYLFTYLDAHPKRFDLRFLLEEYLQLLPDYQQIALEQLDFQRFLFGFFPSYRRSPLNYPWDRLLPIGDSSGMQSPVSFGGFGSMLRHLRRLCDSIDDALKQDLLDRRSLAQLQPYQPNLSVTWLFQKAMSVGVDQGYRPNQINDLLIAVFQVMARLGEDTLNPFLQDVVQFQGLAKTLPRVNLAKVIPLLPRLGAGAIADWCRHYLALGLYASGHILDSRIPLGDSFSMKRRREAWFYGSGQDFHLEINPDQ